MRRFWFIKYMVTLLASVALTFHLLHLGIKNSSREDQDSFSLEAKEVNIYPPSYIFAKSNSYLRRKLSQGNLVTSHDTLTPPRWAVLSGNVTVHKGVQHSPNYVRYNINSPDVCAKFSDHKPKLLIFVASSAVNFERRRAIRDTWGLQLLQSAYNYRIIFLLGKSDKTNQSSLMLEKYRYGDLVQTNLTDSFRNLGRKSVAGLQWSKEFCHQSDFVMKTDDDILVHVPNLLKALNGAVRTDPLLMCHENRMRQILRKNLLDRASLPANYHKYEVSENELPGRFYPPYCSGMAYVFSSSVRNWLLEASEATPIFFIEDVYLTGFCRHKAGIFIKPLSGITLRPPISANQAACSFRDGRVTSQEVGVDELRELWVELNTQGFFCPELVGLRQSSKKSLNNRTALLREKK